MSFMKMSFRANVTQPLECRSYFWGFVTSFPWCQEKFYENMKKVFFFLDFSLFLLTLISAKDIVSSELGSALESLVGSDINHFAAVS